MDLDRGPAPAGPDPSGLADRAPEAPSATDGNTAVAALAPDERAGLDAMGRTITAHLDAIQAGGAVPAGFAGALQAHDAVLAGLGLAVPETHAAERALVAGAPEVQRSEARAPELPSPEPAGSQQGVEGRTRDPDPEAVRQAQIVFRDVLAPGAVVTRVDLDRLTETVRASTPEDMRAVYDSLGRDERAQWAATLAADYSPAQRSEVYGLLVDRFDRQHLLTFAYYHTHPGSDGTDGRLLGQAVAQHAPEAAAAAFVRDAATYAVPAQERGALSEQTAALEARPDIGVAAAAALSGLQGPAMDRTLGELHHSGRLGAVVEGSIDTRVGGNADGNLILPTLGADSLVRILRSAKLSENDLVSASLVNAAARELTRLESSERSYSYGNSSEQVRDGITGILRQDPVGVLQNYSEYVAPDGRGALTDYFGSMLRAGQMEAVRGIVTSLSTGNGTAASSAEWALQEFPDPERPSIPYLMNAKTLAFTVGSIGRAVEAASESARERAEMVKQIFGAATDAAGVTAPRAGPVWSLVERAFGALVDRRAERQVDSNEALLDDLTRRSTPTHADGRPLRGGALDYYEERLGRTLSGVAGPDAQNRTPARP